MTNFVQTIALFVLSLGIVVIDSLTEVSVFSILALGLTALGVFMVYRGLMSGDKQNWAYVLVGLSSLLVGINKVVFGKVELLASLKGVGMIVALVMCLYLAFLIAMEYLIRGK